MPRRFVSMAACLTGLVLLSVPAAAIPIANCDTSFTVCSIPENILFQLPSPFAAIAGDVVLIEPGSATVSDVFRIFNNLIDTGGGTGLGNMVFLYSSDDTTLPNPSTYSANAAFREESASGITAYTGNGTTYLLATPEPQTLILAAAAVVVLARRRSGKFQGDL